MILYAFAFSVHSTVASLLETNLLCIFIHWKCKMADYFFKDTFGEYVIKSDSDIH